MAKNLIIYYSRRGQNYWNGSIRELKKGNTEIVAEFIQKAVGGDLFEIENVQDYPVDYMQTTEAAQDELHDVYHALEDAGCFDAADELSNALRYYGAGNDALENALDLAKNADAAE